MSDFRFAFSLHYSLAFHWKYKKVSILQTKASV